jgi:S-methylmethionine-dependent homocysteine/selenocysteine methylase
VSQIVGASAASRAPAYRYIESLLASGQCVILDGGVETEVQRLANRDPDPSLWGTGALYQTPETVLDVHRGHIAGACNVISTATWSILSAPEAELDARLSGDDPSHWIDVARLGIQLARKATIEAGREKECAVAFAISEEINSPRRRETIELLQRMFAEDPPDMLLLETLTLIREPQTFEMVQLLLETGLPVWLSYRRCRHGVCGVHGQHWGPPEGDLFGRAARRFEEMGVEALLINCLPVDHVPGMLGWLRDFTELSLGVYPNLGHLSGPRWRFDDSIDPAAYAELALGWRAEGAQIIGGCCGVTAAHIAALEPALRGTTPGRRRPPAGALRALEPAARALPDPWLDEHGVDLFPLPLPKLSFDSGVFVPTHGSFLVWKHLFRSGIGAGASCLDMGCGSGILSVQLALNGASNVHAIDIDRNAVACTISNAYRNGVGERVTGEDIDLFQWTPEARYDLIVASLFQMPVDPYEEPSGHRPLDYWGRNMLDHFVGKLPDLLGDGGRALIMQLSIVGQAATSQRLAEGGLSARVVDFTFFPFGPLFTENKAQIERVEHLSDAFHLQLGDDDVMVAYLIEVSRAADQSHSDNGA